MRAKTKELKRKALATAALEGQKIKKTKQKKEIRVAFVVNFGSAWKLDCLYELMQNDPHFSPCIIIAPIIGQNSDWSQSEVSAVLNYHQDRNREIYVGEVDDDFNRNLLEKIAPDIVFATNPFALVPTSLHFELIEKYLVCYVPYHMEVGRYGGDQAQYNSLFHNSVWKIFSPHSVSLKTFQDVQIRQGENVIVTGYPGIEKLISPSSSQDKAWKPGVGKKIIWAPHHTIDTPSLPYSNFIEFAEFFKSLAGEYSGRIRWCFKPHPLLFPKLLNHPNWGEERTTSYFEFWREHESSQVETGEYIDLFKESDAMIHDCGSFLAEYLYVDKPVLYMWSSPNVTSFFNDFGLKALSACSRADDETHIRNFIENLIAQEDDMQLSRKSFLQEWSFEGCNSPSERILSHLKQELSSQS